MSKVSIYENSWIEIVFEGRNKEYGAYQLRQESDKTTVLAFFIGLALVFTAAIIPLLLNNFGNKNPIIETIPKPIDQIITLTNIIVPKPEKPIKAVLPIKKKEEDETKKEVLKNPEIVKPDDANAITTKNTENEKPKNENTETSIDGTFLTETGTVGTAINTAAPINPRTINKTTDLDKMPEFPGGIKKFYTYVGNNFDKPEIEIGQTLTVIVYFVIEKDGSLTDIQVKRDPGYGLGNEAIRVLKSLKTKWTPGMIDGQAVRTAYNLPITLKLE